MTETNEEFTPNTNNPLAEEVLLNDVSSIIERYKEQQEKSGELFNIFTITRIERKEVNTHSTMIAELLNPKGRHGQGDKFLKLFLQTIFDESFFDTEKVKVFKEKAFKEGRIDIVIELDKAIFFIENKIDADDGNQQLKRYSKILNEYYKDKRKSNYLIYLTKFGDDAEEYSHKGVSYKSISYKEHIIKWLDLCIQKVENIPPIKYALLQYQYVVKKITGTTMTQNMKNELVNLLIKDNNFDAALAILNVIQQAKGEILFRFFKDLGEAVTNKLKFVSIISEGNFPNFEYYDKTRCAAWFCASSKDTTHYIGIFLDIGIPNILFRVEVATELLHYGVVSVEKDEKNKYTFSKDWKNLKTQINIPDKFEPRDWGIKWFSKSRFNVYGDKNLNSIRNENAQNITNEVIEAIRSLRKVNNFLIAESKPLEV